MGVEINELETPALLLEKIFENYDIEVLALDIDNTVLMTNEYYWLWQDACSTDIAEMFLTSIPTELFVERMDQNLRLVFEKGVLLPIDTKYKEALSLYFYQNIPERFQEYIDFTRTYFSDFYHNTPEITEGSIEVLKFAYARGKSVVFNSHAQLVWTYLKVKKFEENLGVKNIPFNAVDISLKKDAKSWSNSVEKVGVRVEKALVVGDSWNSDILPAINAGCRNLVWINRDIEKLPLEIRENPDIHIWCVDSIKDLLKPIS